MSLLARGALQALAEFREDRKTPAAPEGRGDGGLGVRRRRRRVVFPITVNILKQNATPAVKKYSNKTRQTGAVAGVIVLTR
jgi:hypothetical protein